MVVARTVLSALLALLFAAAAAGKLARARSEVDKATKLRIRWSRYRLIAIPEAAAAVGLLAGLAVAPIGVAAAIGLVALMASALAFRLRVRDAIPLLAGDAVVMLLAGVSAALAVLAT